MADASSGGGRGRGAPRPSTAANLTPSTSAPSSLDGGLLLRLLQNPPPRPNQQQTPVQPLPEQHNFVDPAVAAVGSLFPYPPQVHGRGFAWPSSSAATQPQLRFPDPRFAQPSDPYAERGGAGLGSVDGVARSRGEKPRTGAPPPGFGKASPPGFGNASHPREVQDVFGGMQQNMEQGRESNHQHPKGFGRAQNNEHQMMPPFAGGQGVLGRLPHGEHHTPPITVGRGTASGMLYMEQQQDRILSRTPPDANAHGIVGRMPHGEHHMPQFAGGRLLPGDHHSHPSTGGRIPHQGQRQQQPGLANMSQHEPRWQGHGSQKLPNANVCEMKVKEKHQVIVPASTSVGVDVREDRGKKMLAETNGLEVDGVGEVGYEHGMHGRVVVEGSNFEVPYHKGEVRFAGKTEQDDESKEEDAIIEQFMDTVVIEGNGEANNVVVQSSGSRSKVNWKFLDSLL